MLSRKSACGTKPTAAVRTCETSPLPRSTHSSSTDGEGLENLMRDYITAQIDEARRVMSAMLANDSLVAIVESAAQACVSCIKQGGKVLLAGNGGSAADAQHIAAEFVNRFCFDRPGLAAIALTTDTSILTSIG